MEDIILNVTLTGWLVSFFCMALMEFFRYEKVPYIVSLFVVKTLFTVVSVFGAITLIWIR